MTGRTASIPFNFSLLLLITLWLLIPFVLPAQDGFADIFSDEPESGQTSADGFFIEESSTGIEVTGKAAFKLKSFLDEETGSEWRAGPALALDLRPYSGNLEAMIRLRIDGTMVSVPGEPDFLSPADTTLTPASLFDELSLRYFFSGGFLEAGLMKVEWGKGDGFHVLDPVNPLNQSAGVLPDLNEMKDPVNMIKLNLYAGPNGLAELIFLPLFKGITLADSGRWVPADLADLTEAIPNLPSGMKASSAAFRYSFFRRPGGSRGPVLLRV